MRILFCLNVCVEYSIIHLYLYIVSILFCHFVLDASGSYTANDHPKVTLRIEEKLSSLKDCKLVIRILSSLVIGHSYIFIIIKTLAIFLRHETIKHWRGNELPTSTQLDVHEMLYVSMLSCFLDNLTHSFIHWWITMHISVVTAPLIYVSVKYIRARQKLYQSVIFSLRTGSIVAACHVATVVICMHVMQTVWGWQMWLRACEAQCGPGTCAMRRELQSVSVSALRWALPQSYTQSLHHWSTPKTQANA